MKSLIISHSDISGGAARAAYRLHKSLYMSSVNSTMLVSRKLSDDYSVLVDNLKFDRLSLFISSQISALFQKQQKTTNSVFHSSNIIGSSILDKINQSNADIVNLHWVNRECLSVKQISKVNKPVVMTLHDMWAFCGSEHYTNGEVDERYIEGYTESNRPEGHSGIDIDRATWLRKVKYWKKPFTIVTPSNWLSKCARKSALFRGWPIHTIPNALDTSLYRPIDKELARELLGLPQECRLIGFGAIGGGRDPRKGYDLLQDALMQLSGKIENTTCVICGQSKPEYVKDVGMPQHYLGHLNDDITLALFYNAIDVMVVPSRMDNFPQSATEAQSCGTPVVAFDTTGLIDVVEHKKSGYLAKAFDTNDLAAGLHWCLFESHASKVSHNSRRRAVELWDSKVVADQYSRLFKEVARSA
ncbi:glycosyltransferase [Vibrio sp. M260118]|uniref:glycosyltransferase n=1 Tax=Vibrio sp. M260118 TaxID=3020896 RepID=UPI002F3F574F